MVATGCLLLFVLPLLGMTIGGMIAGLEGAAWGAAAGFCIAAAACGFLSYALVRIARRR